MMSALKRHPSESDAATSDANSAWLFAGAMLELLAWGVLWGLLGFLVPRQQQMLADFGVAVPETVKGIFAASTLIRTYWYLVLPSIALLVLGTVYLVVAFGRTPVMRVALLVILAIVPLGWALWCHLAMMAVTSQLIQDLS